MLLENWYRVDLIFTTLFLHIWIEVIIQDANNLLGFILTMFLVMNITF